MKGSDNDDVLKPDHPAGHHPPNDRIQNRSETVSEGRAAGQEAGAGSENPGGAADRGEAGGAEPERYPSGGDGGKPSHRPVLLAEVAQRRLDLKRAQGRLARAERIVDEIMDVLIKHDQTTAGGLWCVSTAAAILMTRLANRDLTAGHRRAYLLELVGETFDQYETLCVIDEASAPAPVDNVVPLRKPKGGDDRS